MAKEKAQETWLVLESMPYCNDIDITPFSTKDEATMYVKKSVESYDTGWDEEENEEGYEHNVEIQHRDDYSYATITIYEDDAALYADTVEWRVVKKTLSELIPGEEASIRQATTKPTVGYLKKACNCNAITNAFAGYPDDKEVGDNDLVFMPDVVAYTWWDEAYLRSVANDVKGEKVSDSEFEEMLESTGNIEDDIIDAIDNGYSVYDAVYNMLSPGDDDYNEDENEDE